MKHCTHCYLIINMIIIVLAQLACQANPSMPTDTAIPSTPTATPTATRTPTIAPSTTPTRTPTLVPTSTQSPRATVVLPTLSEAQAMLVLDGEPYIRECPISTISGSVVWVEPGPKPGTILVLNQVPPELLNALGLEKQPDLLLDISPVLTTGGFKGQAVFRYGTIFYGATTGSVKIAGQDRRNINGAKVIAKESGGTEASPPLFGQIDDTGCSKLSFELDPPFIASTH
jgi:hypothetical protein